MYNCCDGLLREKILGGAEACIETVWNNMVDRPAFPEHPMQRHSKSFKTFVIPVAYMEMVLQRRGLASAVHEWLMS